MRVGSLAAASLGIPGGVASARAENEPAMPVRGGRILGARLGHAIRYPDLHGDIWTTAWADDGDLYSLADDTRGCRKAPINSNLAVFRIRGGPPPRIEVENVNPMSDYGRLGEVKAEDGACWKGSGIACIDGVLYLSVCRHHYMEARGFWVEQCWDASIVKSTDHGRTWSQAPRIGQAMFPGRIFSNPYFVTYGRDGRGGKDGSDEFVYAVSNDGAWNNGNSMILGRVRRRLIGRLEAADWEFVHGYDEEGDPIWRPRHDNALYVFRSPGRVGMTGITYLPGIARYVTPQWYHPRLNNPWADPQWNVTRFDFYDAAAPWGPWSLFHSQQFSFEGYYCPSIPAKFISDDGRKFWLFAAGDSLARSTAGGSDPFYYTINMIPVTLEMES